MKTDREDSLFAYSNNRHSLNIYDIETNNSILFYKLVSGRSSFDIE